MDGILNALLNCGIGGIMAAAVVWFLYHLTQKILPDILEKQRVELREARTEFRATLKEENELFRSSLAAVEDRWSKAVESICVRMEALDRHSKRNEEQFIALREHLARYFPGPTGGK